MSQSRLFSTARKEQSPPSLSPRQKNFVDFPTCDAISQSMFDLPFLQEEDFPAIDDAGSDHDRMFLEDLNQEDALNQDVHINQGRIDVANVPSPITDVPLPNLLPLPNYCTQLATVNNCRDIRPSFIPQETPKEIRIRGLRSLPHPQLHAASKGKEKLKSENNNRWALKRVDDLRVALGCDVRIPFGDLPLQEIDFLLSELFSRVVKVDGTDYPAESLSNMLGGFNRILRRASDLRSLRGEGEPLGRHFCIKKHSIFTRTRMVLDAAIKKMAEDGINKKRQKVMNLTECHEVAVLADVDHEATHNLGCQKRVVFYLLCRCGIRGGKELWCLKRIDLGVLTDKDGKEFVKFKERHSKNNPYDIDHTKEEQFRQTYYSYESDFIFTVKQYLRHLPPLGEGVIDSLFLRPIQGPAGNIWYNRAFRISQDVAGRYLKNMLTLVGLPADLIISNKSGRATLITRMCAKGIPDHIGMMVTGHHTQDAYQRYDRTKDLKIQAAIAASNTRGLNYDTALAQASKVFVEKDLVGTSAGLTPLIANTSMQPLLGRVSESASSASCMQFPKEVQVEEIVLPKVAIPKQVEEKAPNDDVRVLGLTKKLEAWNAHYDGIDWELALLSDPNLRNALASRGEFLRSGLAVATGSSGSGSTFSGNFAGCVINVYPNFNPTVRNNGDDEKENRCPQ